MKYYHIILNNNFWPYAITGFIQSSVFTYVLLFGRHWPNILFYFLLGWAGCFACYSSVKLWDTFRIEQK